MRRPKNIHLGIYLQSFPGEKKFLSFIFIDSLIIFLMSTFKAEPDYKV